jgi:hypothetical protein
VHVSIVLSRIKLMSMQTGRRISGRVLQDVYLDPVCLGADQYIGAHSLFVCHTRRSVKGVGLQTVK